MKTVFVYKGPKIQVFKTAAWNPPAWCSSDPNNKSTTVVHGQDKPTLETLRKEYGQHRKEDDFEWLDKDPYAFTNRLGDKS